VQAVYANLNDTISYVFPYFATQIAVMMWMTRGRVLPVMADLSQLLGATEIARAVTIGLFKPKGHKFKVTAKGGDRNASFVQWPMLRVFLIYLGMTVAGVMWAFSFDDSRPLADSSAMALFWSWYNILVLTLACFVCVESSQRRNGERFVSNEFADVTYGHSSRRLRVRNISVSGMRLVCDESVTLGADVQISLGQLEADARVARRYDDGFAVEFVASQAVREGLIRHVYCGDYSSTVETIRPGSVVLAAVGRVFR